MYKVRECEHCKGKGYIITQGTGTIYRFARIKCGHCQGTGVIKTVIQDRYSSVKQNLY